MLLRTRKTTKSLILKIAVALIAAAFMFSAVTYAKYVKTTEGKDSAYVGAFAFDYTKDTEFVLSTVSPTSGAQTFLLSMSNSSGGRVSEVAIGYTVTVTTTNNLPLKITVRRDGGNSNILENGLGTGIEAVVSNSGEFAPSVDETHNYVLEIVWDSHEYGETAAFADELDLIRLSVEWKQIIV